MLYPAISFLGDTDDERTEITLKLMNSKYDKGKSTWKYSIKLSYIGTKYVFILVYL